MKTPWDKPYLQVLSFPYSKDTVKHTYSTTAKQEII